MRARLESDLHPAVKAFLQKQGYDVKGEIGGCDVAGRVGSFDPTGSTAVFEIVVD